MVVARREEAFASKVAQTLLIVVPSTRTQLSGYEIASEPIRPAGASILSCRAFVFGRAEVFS